MVADRTGRREPVVAVLVGVLVLAGCGRRLPLVGPPRLDEAAFARKPLAEHRLRTATPDGPPVDTVIGAPRAHRVRTGETLLDVARWYDVGYNEIVEANPGVDPWVPPPGTRVVVPTQWVLPCCSYEGIVLNIPEMRLYFYERRAADRHALVVHTYPVGLGRGDRRTPRGRFRIIGKTVNPRWNIPESIRQEHIRERGDARTFIPGGDPENPLGRYRLDLSIRPYAIHGTNVAWGAGMPVSHGCARLYPEDIEKLFPRVAIGTPVELLYQPVKAGRRGDEVYVEVHPDLYRMRPVRDREALGALDRRKLRARADAALVPRALAESRGLPYRVTRAGAPTPTARQAKRATPAS